MKKIIIFGGTGFIGKTLADYLKNSGYEVLVIARNKPVNFNHAFSSWDAETIGPWKNTLKNAFAVVNLCGRSVDCIKNPANCDLILRSRVATTLLISKALKEIKTPPKIWIQMSTAHIYGDPPKKLCTEDSAFGYGLAPFVAKKWEKALLQNLPQGTREVRLRTSFVIGPNGGAFDKLKLIARLGLGGRVGHGKQGLSWIHITDLCKFIKESIENENFHGPYIISSPNPVSQKEFIKTLRKVYHIPIGLPNPSFLIKIGAPLIFRSDPELLLYGRYVKSKRIEEETNFKFKYPHLIDAIENIKAN